MSKVTKTFHLGKRANVIALDDNQEAILYGKTEYDTDTRECRLSMLVKIHAVGAEFNADNPGRGNKTLFAYASRSEAFQSGEFTNELAIRYIKSRYRDFTTLVNVRMHTGAEKRAALVAQAEAFHAEERRNAAAAETPAPIAEVIPAVEPVVTATGDSEHPLHVEPVAEAN